MKKLWLLFLIPSLLLAAPKEKRKRRTPPPEPDYPPALPGDRPVATHGDVAFLMGPDHIRKGVAVAKTPPRIDFMYYPGQDYPGKPWSVWGDGTVANGRYYSAIGDHLSPEGNAFVYSYDPTIHLLKRRVDLRKLLNRPEGHYTAGKIHSQVSMGKDGWLYFSTHRGSTRVAQNPENHFEGDWICRYHPKDGRSEIVAHAPLPMQSLPTGFLDPERLLWYGSTQDGLNEKPSQFLVYDVQNKKVLYSDEAGPARAMIFSSSTGRVYFYPEKSGPAQLRRFDPAQPGKPELIDAELGLRAASQETKGGKVYTIERDALWAFDTKTETAKLLGETAVGEQTYITTVDLDPKTERYLYYCPGAHGGSWKDGSPLVQYDLKTNSRKVIAFLFPFYHRKIGFIAQGTYAIAVSEDGSKVYITWHGNRGVVDLEGKVPFNTCALTVVHVPESERQP